MKDIGDMHVNLTKESEVKPHASEVKVQIDNMVEQVHNIIELQDSQSGVDGHAQVKGALQDVIDQVKDTIDVHQEELETKKELQKKAESMPILLEGVAKQVKGIIKRHDDVPGLNGHDHVQASLQEVV